MDIKPTFESEGGGLNKESRLYFISALAFIIIAMGALVFYLLYIFWGVAEKPKAVGKDMGTGQVYELNVLRGEQQPFTPEEVKTQASQLDEIQEQKDITYTNKETQKQFEELDKLSHIIK